MPMRYRQAVLSLVMAGQLTACVNYHPETLTKGSESSIGQARITTRGDERITELFHVRVVRDSVIGFADHRQTRRFAFAIDDVQQIERGEVAVGATVALIGTLAVVGVITFFAVAFSSLGPGY